MPNKFVLPSTNSATRTSATPLQAEVFYDTDQNKLYHGDGTTQGGKKIQTEGDPLTLDHITTPSAPDTNKTIVYAKADNKLYYRPSGGSETEVGSGGGRELLTADRTYYLRTDGSDSNDGLTNTAGGAFLTIQKFFDVLGAIDTGGFNVTGQIVDGTYPITSSIKIKEPVGSGDVILKGNTITPTNVLITSANNIVYLDKKTPGKIHLEGISFSNTGANNDTTFLNLVAGLTTFKLLNFGATTTGANSSQSHITVAGGATCIPTGGYSISGKANFHVLVSNLSLFRDDYIFSPPGSPVPITITGTPQFSFFVYCYGGTYALGTATFTGGITGQKFGVELNGVVTGSASIPGTGSSVSTGGQVG